MFLFVVRVEAADKRLSQWRGGHHDAVGVCSGPLQPWEEAPKVSLSLGHGNELEHLCLSKRFLKSPTTMMQHFFFQCGPLIIL